MGERKIRRAKTLQEIEHYFKTCKEAGLEMEWRVCDGMTRYKICAEEISSGTLCTYQAKLWDEVVEFCRTRCNPGYNTINGLGCTEPELVNATIEYIHSIGKKYRYEDVELD